MDMVKGRANVDFRAACVVIDKLLKQEEFKRDGVKVQDVAGELDVTPDTLQSYFRGLSALGAMDARRKPGCGRQRFYYPMIECFSDAYDKGEFEGVLSAAQASYKQTGTHRAPKAQADYQDEPNDEVVIDPVEMLEQLDLSTITELLHSLAQRNKADVIYLRGEVARRDGEIGRLTGQVTDLRDELRLARTRLMEVESELSNMQSHRVVRELPPRHLVVKTNQPIQRQHGASSNGRATVVVHRKPHIGDHAPSSVVRKRD